LTGRSCWQVHRRGEEAIRVAAPSLATTDGALETAADRVRITIKHEAATRIENVLERSATDADLQEAAIKPAFKVEIVAEDQLGGVALDGNAGRVEPLVTDCVRIVNERGIRQRISRREGISII
jgi:hypothetical protein